MEKPLVFVFISSSIVCCLIRPVILPQTLCPSICFCKWKSGKQTAECVGQKIGFVPSELDEDTLVLDLSRNRFGTLVNNVFERKGLVNLQRVYLSESRISTIEPNAFFQLLNLIELDLGSNYLMTIPSESFYDCRHLRRLVLSRNPIRSLSNSSFMMLQFLTFLDLSGCEIVYIHPDTFEGLIKLSVLKLDNNYLKTLMRPVFEPLVSLAQLELHGNPWNCDCRTREVREWMIERNIPIAEPPYCVEPKRLNGISWEGISLEDFACHPSVFTPLTPEISILSGHNVSLECNVESSPRSMIYWEVHGKHSINTSFHSDYREKYRIDSYTTPNSSGQTSRLTVVSITEDDDNIYTCFAENAAGTESLNFTISVVSTRSILAPWNVLRIALFGVAAILIVAMLLSLCALFKMYPSLLPTGPKFDSIRLLRRLGCAGREDAVDEVPVADEENVVAGNSGKSQNQENQNGERDSDDLTPDLVVKVEGKNGGTTSSTQTTFMCSSSSDPCTSTSNTRYGHALNTLSEMANDLSSYAGSFERPTYTEIYPNPCHVAIDMDHLPTTSRPLPTCYEEDFSPQSANKSSMPFDRNARAKRKLRGNSLRVTSKVTHHTLIHKSRYSPDEGYGEGFVEGTEV